MKKLAFRVLAITVSAVSFLPGQASACDRVRVVHQPAHVVYHAPVVRTSAVIHATPVVSSRTVFVESKPQPSARPVSVEVAKPRAVTLVAKAPEIEQGSTIKARVRFAGLDAGEVTITTGSLQMRCDILDWQPEQVQFRVPILNLLEDSRARIEIRSSTGVVRKSIDFLLTRGADFEVEPPLQSVVEVTANDL